MAFDIFGVFLDALNFARKNRKKSALILIAGTAMLSFATGLFSHFVFALLIVAELVVAFFVGELDLKKIGLELVTFITVLAGVVYGPLAGAVMGIVLLMLHFVLTRNLGPYVAYCIPAMGVIGLIAGYASSFGAVGTDIAVFGVMLSLLYNLITGGLGSLMLNDFFEELVWSGSNFALNFVLFSAFAPVILSVLL